jgi:hypothetical protein
VLRFEKKNNPNTATFVTSTYFGTNSLFVSNINRFLNNADTNQNDYAKAWNSQQNKYVPVNVFRDIGSFVPKNIAVNEYSNGDNLIRFTRTPHVEITKNRARTAEMLMLVLFMFVMLFVVGMQLK